MKFFLKLILSPFFGKKMLQGFFKTLHLFALKGMNFGGGVSPKDSGEYYVVNYVIKKIGQKKPIIFDVGGNKGDYTKLWLECLGCLKKSADIYIFEPSAILAGELKTKFLNKASVYSLAIGDKQGQAVLFADNQGSGLGSLFNRDIGHVGIVMKRQEEVMVETLDAFCESNKFQRIDFLKLDIEGNEFSALKGATALLQKRAIKFIQFEFGGTDIDARVFFKDFYTLLSPNFHIYRILKNGLYPIKKYSELDEIFVTTNYLAEQRD